MVPIVKKMEEWTKKIRKTKQQSAKAKTRGCQGWLYDVCFLSNLFSKTLFRKFQFQLRKIIKPTEKQIDTITITCEERIFRLYILNDLGQEHRKSSILEMANITLSCSFGMIHQKNLNQSERSQLDYPRPATICYAGREERWNRQTDNSDEKVFLIDGAIKESGSSNGIFFHIVQMMKFVGQIPKVMNPSNNSAPKCLLLWFSSLLDFLELRNKTWI